MKFQHWKAFGLSLKDVDQKLWMAVRFHPCTKLINLIPVNL